MGGRAHQPRLDPGRPARGELRHLHGRRRGADLRRQRLRRGLPRPLHLGHQAVGRQRGAAGVAKAISDATSRPGRDATPRPTSTRCGTSSRPTPTRSSRCAWRPRTARSIRCCSGAKLRTRVMLLDELTETTRTSTVGSGRRRGPRLDEDERRRCMRGVRRATWRPFRRRSASGRSPTTVKDVVGRSGFGIGRAGLPAYNVLIEGFNAGAGQRHRAVDEARQRGRPVPDGDRRADRLVLQAPRAPDRGVAAGAAGPRRPAARLHRAG